MARPRRGGQHFEKMLATSLDFFVVSNSRSAQVSFISMETAISFWLLPRVPRIERDKRFVATCGCFRSRKKKKRNFRETLRCIPAVSGDGVTVDNTKNLLAIFLGETDWYLHPSSGRCGEEIDYIFSGPLKKNEINEFP